MILLDVESLRKHFGPEPVLDGVTFEVRPGERIGLAGPNGSGKTTLLRILAGREEADAGAVRLAPLRASRLSRTAAALGARPHALGRGPIGLGRPDGLAGARRWQWPRRWPRATDPAEHKRLADRYDHLQHEIQRRDAYNLEHKIERVLDGLRFRRESFRQPVESLSGGEQNRLMLAKLLLAEPEPDAPGRALQPPRHRGHRVAGRFSRGKFGGHAPGQPRPLLSRQGDQRARWNCFAARSIATWAISPPIGSRRPSGCWCSSGPTKSSRSKSPRPKDFIRRNHYGQKHAQAEDRRKKLERIELVPLPREIRAPPMGFPAAARSRRHRGPRRAARQGLRAAAVRRRRLSRCFAASVGACWDQTAAARPRCCAVCWAGAARRGPVRLGQGVVVGLFRPAVGRTGRRAAGRRGHPPRTQAVQRAAAPRSAGPLRTDRRHGVAAGGQSQRRRAMPGGPGPAGGRRCEFARPRRAHQPPRSLGPRRLGAGLDEPSTARCSSSATIAISSIAWPIIC